MKTEDKIPKDIILLVDDYFGVGEALKGYLEIKNHYVILYKDGESAIDEIEDELRYDLAIIDLELPKISGEEVMKVSKKINPKIPVICISAYSRCPNGFNAYLTKPFLMESLDRTIEMLLSGRKNL
jgi:DNA-binding response OmpR family regulator